MGLTKAKTSEKVASYYATPNCLRVRVNGFYAILYTVFSLGSYTWSGIGEQLCGTIKRQCDQGQARISLQGRVGRKKRVTETRNVSE